jgi:hypothetical protein
VAQNAKSLQLEKLSSKQGTLTEGGRLSTVDLLIKGAPFERTVNNNFNIK